MFRFIESICFHQEYLLLHLHQQRIERTFKSFFPESRPFNLIDELPPLTDHYGKHKLRIVYDTQIRQIEAVPYIPRAIKQLQLLVNNNLDYAFKYENRDHLHSLDQSKNTELEYIFVKENSITDSSYANLAFWDSKNWFTPDTPLLAGVKREYLLKTGQLIEKRITPENLYEFEKVSLINALLDLGEMEIPIDRVRK